METTASRIRPPTDEMWMEFPYDFVGGSDVNDDGFPDIAAAHSDRQVAYVLFGGGDW